MNLSTKPFDPKLEDQSDKLREKQWLVHDIDGDRLTIHAAPGRLISLHVLSNDEGGGNNRSFSDLSPEQATELAQALLAAVKLSESTP